MNVPGIGTVTKDDELGWYFSEPLAISALRGRICRIVLEGYAEDPKQEEFHIAIANLLSSERDLLDEAEEYVYLYYEGVRSTLLPSDSGYADIDRAQLWNHVQVGSEPMVSRRTYGDKGIYVSLECNCNWEPEHGLQLVFKNGSTIKKVGPYDGHLANSDAYADDRLENVVYHSKSQG
jgi:hypothetical protein